MPTDPPTNLVPLALALPSQNFAKFTPLLTIPQHFSGVGNFIECPVPGVCGGKGGNILNIYMRGALYRPSL